MMNRHSRKSLKVVLVFGIALFAVGCDGDEPKETDAGVSDTTAGDTASTPDDTGPKGADAAESLPTSPGDYVLTIRSGGTERTFGLHIPESFTIDADTPVYFVFHGGGNRSNRQKIARMRNLGFDAKADADGGLIVYPGAGHPGEENKKWNDGRSATDGADDIAFVEDLLGRLDAQLGVDAERVYATGASNGGFFSYRIACELAGQFAAVAPVIAAFPEEQASECAPAEPISVLAIQGTEDPFMSYCGGDASHDTLGVGAGGPIESAGRSRAFWVDKNGCDSTPTIESLAPKTDNPETTVYRWKYRGCDGSVAIDFYGVEGMGHNWPPTETRPRLTGPGSSQLNGTDRIWQFFRTGDSFDGRRTIVSEPNLGLCED